MAAGIGLLVASLLAIFFRLAWRGEGLAHRLAQGVWCRIGSLASYRRSGRHHESLVDIVRAAGTTRLQRLVHRVAPDQSGWFAPFPTDKDGFHDFLRLYDQLLAPYRTRREVRLLEVGVNKGGSLALWREYFAADAHIIGMDVNPWVQRFPADTGLSVVIADSRDAVAARAAVGAHRFDIIIDDGLHRPEAQRRTYEVLRPLLAPHGVYIIEDVYAFDAGEFTTHGDQARVYPDRSGQQLVVLRPPACAAHDSSPSSLDAAASAPR